MNESAVPFEFAVNVNGRGEQRMVSLETESWISGRTVMIIWVVSVSRQTESVTRN
ncbi:hypothetical protein D3C86_1985600 [compost metagenome]